MRVSSTVRSNLVALSANVWAGDSATFREGFRYQELVELLAVSETELVAFAGGQAFRVDSSAAPDAPPPPACNCCSPSVRCAGKPPTPRGGPGRAWPTR